MNKEVVRHITYHINLNGAIIVNIKLREISSKRVIGLHRKKGCAKKGNEKREIKV